jgi:hypothetical protein
MSGTEKAMEGIWEAKDEGISWIPVAENDPDGTGHNWETKVAVSHGLKLF